jgi:hypothetical protein
MVMEAAAANRTSLAKKKEWYVLALREGYVYVHEVHLEHINETFSCPKRVQISDLIFSHLCSSCIVIYNYICLADLA